MTKKYAVTNTHQKFTCRHCKSDIDKSAAKCPHCQSFIGRLGWLRNATNELSAVSLLVAVIALSLPAIKSLLPQKSDLVVAVLKAEGQTFEFMVSNNGNRPAAITQAGLEFPIIQKENHLSSWVILEESGFRSILIEPEKSYRFASKVMSGLPPLQANPGMSEELPAIFKTIPENCSLKLVYRDFDGSEHITRKPYRCFAG
jgi:hypothetical protein